VEREISAQVFVLYNDDGWVLQRSSLKFEPKLLFPVGQVSTATAQVYDCRGNGKRAKLLVDTKIITAESRQGRTGSWSPVVKNFGSGALACSGKCSLTFMAKGKQSVLIGDGAADVYVAGRLILKIPSSTSGLLRTSESFNVGNKNAVVRIQGKNFVLGGLANVESQLTEITSSPKRVDVVDPSLTDSTQKRLSLLGFRIGDFAEDWVVLPMARGTTLLDPTLDICGNNFKSESGREVRRQVTATKPGSPYAFLSTEVVKYRGVTAAEEALNELKSVIVRCRAAGGGQTNGVFTDYVFQQLPQSKAHLVDEQSQVVVRATIGKSETAQQLLAFYQFKGEYFTGLYVVKPGLNRFDESEVIRWFKVALQMGERLGTAGQER
jgi:hypothetical protein